MLHNVLSSSNVNSAYATRVGNLPIVLPDPRTLPMRVLQPNDGAAPVQCIHRWRAEQSL